MKRTAGELAEYLGAVIEGDARTVICGVAGPEKARASDVIYADSPKNEERAANSAARCVLCGPRARLRNKITLRVEQPKLAFSKAAAWLADKPQAEAGIHATAVIAASARLGADVTMGPYAVIEEHVQIGEGTRVEAFCFLGHGSAVGRECRLHPRVTLYAGARLGDRVEVHSGVVIGSDGFGYSYGEGRHWKFPQIGGVEIGDDVEIGCNTTIDRGSLDDTRIGAGAKIDNLVQVAHNVRIGEHSVIAAQTGISGSTVVGCRVSVGGQAGIGDHCRIEDDANVGGQAGVVVGKTVRRGQTVWGTPARSLDKFKEQYAGLSQLPKLVQRVKNLEKKQSD